MIRMMVHDLESAIHWLTTTCFNESPFDLLAVALDQVETGDLTQALNDRKTARKFHRADNAVIFTLSPSKGTPQTPAAVANPDVSKWLDRLNKKVLNCSKKPNATSREIFNTILNLLNIQESTLPAVYLRVKDAPPMILPVEDTDAVIDFLLEAFDMAQESKMTGNSCVDLIEETLKEYGLYATCLTKDQQHTLDSGLLGKGHLHYTDHSWMVINILQSAGIHQELNNSKGKYVFKYKNLVYKLGSILATHDAKALNTAVIAYENGDFGTVCRNIGAIIEGSLAGSLTHIIRGEMGVALPQYIDLLDPNKPNITLKNIPLNDHQKYIGSIEKGQKIRWKPPMLNQQLLLIPIAKKENILSINIQESGWRIMTELARSIADMRNPSAHGGEITQEQADASWKYLDQWHSTGCAHALHMIRSALNCWPDLPNDPMSKIKPNYIEESQRIQSTLRTWIQEASLLIRENQTYLEKSKHLNDLQQSLKDMEAYRDSINELSDIFNLNVPPYNAGYVDMYNLVETLKPIIELKKSRKKLKKEILRHIEATGEVYRDVGIYIDHAKHASGVTDFIYSKIITGQAKYRKGDSEVILAKKMTSHTNLLNEIHSLDEDWLTHIKTILTSILEDYHKKVNEVKQVLLEAVCSYEDALKVKECVDKIERSLMENAPPVCICKLKHSLEQE